MGDTLTVGFGFKSYNPRRYGRPWGAIVTFTGTSAQFDFSAGSFLGRPEEGGRVVIRCRPGDIVAKGQRDKNAKNTENSWYVVQEGGETLAVTRAGAFDHWTERQERFVKRKIGPPLKAKKG
jgi:hypothetical protein